MAKLNRRLGEELDDLVRRYSNKTSGDEIAAILVWTALRAHLRATDLKGAVEQLRFQVDALTYSLSREA